ncbi:thioredoxin superfamily protein isoform X2 [Wolffia australiana]
MATTAALRLPAVTTIGRRKAMAAELKRPLLKTFAAISSLSANNGGKQKQLILYTKPGCCLCDGLKEKLETAFLLGGPRSLADVQFHVRDILENSEWERRYQYEIPVLARVLPDGSEEILPRLSPRLGVELIQKKIFAAFEDLE